MLPLQGGEGLIPGLGSKILHATQCGQKFKKKKLATAASSPPHSHHRAMRGDQDGKKPEYWPYIEKMPIKGIISLFCD